jgi:hypothetical protein
LWYTLCFIVTHIRNLPRDFPFGFIHLALIESISNCVHFPLSNFPAIVCQSSSMQIDVLCLCCKHRLCGLQWNQVEIWFITRFVPRFVSISLGIEVCFFGLWWNHVELWSYDFSLSSMACEWIELFFGVVIHTLLHSYSYKESPTWFPLWIYSSCINWVYHNNDDQNDWPWKYQHHTQH